jgi:two-component sensor histidine kinase
MRPSTQRIELGPHPSSARQARRFVHDALLHLGAGAVLDVGVLLASELVTNAVVHGKGAVAVQVAHRQRRTVRISVWDASDHPPEPREPSVEETSGRGLRLVEILATSWGVDPADPEHGKEVWFELSY